jgi:hypothetical protein
MEFSFIIGIPGLARNIYVYEKKNIKKLAIPDIFKNKFNKFHIE